MAQNLTFQQLYKLATDAGFKGASALTVAGIALAESGGNPSARHVNSDGSVDNGVLQINSRAHPNVSVTQADNPSSAFQAAYQISSSGMNFAPWVTYNNGAWKKYIPVGNQIDPGTGKPFKVDPKNQPTEQRTAGLGKPVADTGNPLQQAAGAFNQWRGDVGKNIQKDPMHGQPTDENAVSAATGGAGTFWKDIKDAPMRALKVIVGIVLIISSLILILIPPAKDVLIGTAKPAVKGAIKKAVFA